MGGAAGGSGGTAGRSSGGRRWLSSLSAWRRVRRAGDYACIDRRVGDELPLLHAGLLDPERAAVVEAHVAACHACESTRAGLRVLGDALETLGAEESERAAPDGDAGFAARRRGVAPPLAAVVAIAGAVAALALVVAWQRARDATLVAEIRGLRSEIARVERDAASGVARIAREPDDVQPVIPIAGIRFPSPPNF